MTHVERQRGHRLRSDRPMFLAILVTLAIAAVVGVIQHQHGRYWKYFFAATLLAITSRALFDGRAGLITRALGDDSPGIVWVLIAAPLFGGLIPLALLIKGYEFEQRHAAWRNLPRLPLSPDDARLLRARMAAKGLRPPQAHEDLEREAALALRQDGDTEEQWRERVTTRSRQ